MTTRENQGWRPADDSYPEVMTPEDVMRFLRIGRSSIYELVRLKQIPYFRVGRLLRFNREELRRWAASGQGRQEATSFCST